MSRCFQINSFQSVPCIFETRYAEGERTWLYETIISITLGFAAGMLLTGLLYTSHYIAKLKAAKMCLAK